jgi:hypothetical protein
MSRVARGPQTEAAAARRLLKGLSGEAAALRMAKGCYVLLGPSGASRQAIRVSQCLVEFCLRQDWLERSGEDLILSEAGRAMLRRAEAGDDAYRQQHQLRAAQLREIDGTRRPVVVNDAESPLGWLKSRRDRNGRPLISDLQFEAGERLRADYWFARLSPRVTANWSALAPSGRMRRGAPTDAAGLRDEVIAAKERVMRAIEAVGPELAGLLIDICCELKGLEDAEKSHGWPQRSGKVVLALALTRLARHYGLDVADETRWRGKGIRHWGSEDYRPTLDTWQGTGDQ